MKENKTLKDDELKDVSGGQLQEATGSSAKIFLY